MSDIRSMNRSSEWMKSYALCIVWAAVISVSLA